MPTMNVSQYQKQTSTDNSTSKIASTSATAECLHMVPTTLQNSFSLTFQDKMNRFP